MLRLQTQYGRKNHKMVSNATPPNTDLHVHSFSCDSHSCVRLPPESKTSSISCLQTDIVQPMQYRVLLRCSLGLSSSAPTSPTQETKTSSISCFLTHQAGLQLMQYCVLVRCSLALSSSAPTPPRQEKKTSSISCFFTDQGGARRRKPTRLLWGTPSLCNTASWFLPRLLCRHRHQHHRYKKTKRAAIGTHITEARKQNEQHLVLFHG